MSHPPTEVRPQTESPSATFWSKHFYDFISYSSLLAVAVSICCWDVDASGPLWPDASQYANAAAMIHDWLLSGEIFTPYSFAEQNYARFPAFHMPYHPPAYPGLLGLFFLPAGVSYLSARVFMALCLALSVSFFYALLRRLGTSVFTSLLSSLLLLTTSEVAFWSRDTMSEIPGLAFILAGSYFFIVWLQNGRAATYYMAFCFAEVAFLSRYLTAGLLPAWFLWTLLAGRTRELFSPTAVFPPTLYLTLNTAWILFTLRFSKYETGYGATPPNTNYANAFSWQVISYYFGNIPSMVGWVIFIAALCGAIYTWRFRQPDVRRLIWPVWLLGYFIFVLAVGIYQEKRYFIYALPCFPGLIAGLVDSLSKKKVAKHSIQALLVLCILLNVGGIREFPRGIVGYEVVGRRLATLEEPGNILVASLQQTDLIFRYRSYPSPHVRSFIRADRSLALRPPIYTDVKPVMIAKNAADVLEIIRRGRVRYVITFSPAPSGVDGRTEEMILLHEIMQSQTRDCVFLEGFPLLIEYSKPGSWGQVYLWKFTGELPEGPSEIPVMIPTADITITPST